MEPEPPAVAGGKHPGCSFGRCFCCWIRSCSPRIPPVGPGRDYDRVPLGADDRAAWSVLVGFLPPSSAGTTSLLRLRRFRVARCGRVLGRSDDALEILDDVDYDAKGQSAQISAAAATPSTDGRSLKLCLFCLDSGVPGGSRFEPPARPMEILLDLNAGRRISLHSLPHLPPRPFMPILTISAAGHLWAPGLFLNHGGPGSLVMQRLDKESEQWVQVSTMEGRHCDICYIYGYAVVRDTILLSLKPQHLFVVFNCTTCAWSAVKNENSFPTFTSTLGEYVTHYIPICGRGMYVEEDDTIYFLSKSIIYAYKLCQDHQDQCQYQMALPTIVDRLCPFSDKGSGFLTHLGGRVMCFIWIGVPSCGSQLCCNCDTSHVLITTFRVIGNSGNLEHFIPKGVQVLHSTCRRLDIDPSKSSASDYTFCFLQEYEENAMPPAKKKRENEMAPSMSLDLMEVTASSNVVQSFKMLTCCRDFFNQSHFLRALRLEKSVIQTTTDLYLICQAPSYSTVFKINIIDGRLACLNQNLTPHGMMDTFVCSDPDYLMEQPLPWHFICDSTSIFAVPDKMDNIHVLNLAEGTRDSFEATRPVGIDFSIALALRVGCNVIALSDTLECVYHLSDANQWVGHSIQGSVELEKKVKLSGYVVLGARSFMVRDAKTSCCLLFNLDEDKWTIVRAYSDVSDSPPTGRSARAFLKGKSVFVGGFIYTCADGGLEAYEMIQVQDQYYLGKRISLEFPWCKYWDRNTICFDYVGQDTTSGAVMFCAVQGGKYIHRPGAPHKLPVLITTIQVKTERTSRGTLKPVAVSHVNAGTSFIGLDLGPIWTCSCFALSRMKE